MLAVAILFMISGGLIPFLIEMRIQLEDKKRAMHAAETAYQAVMEYNKFLTNKGDLEIDGINYAWMMEDERICVNYLTHKLIEESVCIETMH